MWPLNLLWAHNAGGCWQDLPTGMLVQCLEATRCGEVEMGIREGGCLGGQRTLETGRRLAHPGHQCRVVAEMERGDPALGRIELQLPRLILKPFDTEACIKSKQRSCI